MPSAPSVCALLCLAVGVLAIPNLTTPDVNIDTDYYMYYDPVLQRNLTSFEVYRINSVLQWGLPGDNAASPGGELGFVLNQYGQTSGYILRYCTEVLVPEGYGYEDLQHGNNPSFASYECCNGGSCSNCGYTGSGTSQVPNMVGRSYNLDTGALGSMAKQFGWWYSFPSAGDCGSNAYGTNGCTFKTSPIVDVVKLQDINVLPGWNAQPQTLAQFQIVNNILVNSFSSSLMNSFRFDATQNQYTLVPGQVRALPSARCTTQCPMGTYTAAGTSGSSSCQPCPIGTYSNTIGTQSCSSCPWGETTNTAGSTSYQACFNPYAPSCAPGTYSYNGHSPCNNCPIGTYQNLAGQSECTPCPTYTTSTTTGAASVSSCVLQQPQAFFVYHYSQSSTQLTGLSNHIGGDLDGEIGYLQSNNYGQTITNTGAVTLRCVESVQSMVTNSITNGGTTPCWPAAQCTYPNPSNQIVSGAGGITNTGNTPIGNWYYFPSAGECPATQQVGQAGCTWKGSTLFQTVSMNTLMTQSFTSLAINPNNGNADADADADGGVTPSQLTAAQVQSNEQVMNSAAFTQTSSVTTISSSTIVGPVVIQNGRCVVQCPAGYEFRSAFTAPYCVPLGTATLYETMDDAEEAIDVNRSRALIATASVVASAIFIAVAAFVAVRVIRSRKSKNAVLLGEEMNELH